MSATYITTPLKIMLGVSTQHELPVFTGDENRPGYAHPALFAIIPDGVGENETRRYVVVFNNGCDFKGAIEFSAEGLALAHDSALFSNCLEPVEI